MAENQPPTDTIADVRLSVELDVINRDLNQFDELTNMIEEQLALFDMEKQLDNTEI